MTVLDTSVVIDYLLGSDAGPPVEALFRDEGAAAAPDLLVFEVLAVLRRAAARDELPTTRADAAIADLGDMAVDLFPTLPLRERAWELRHNMTAADGIFVALAEALDEPFATKDAGLARAVQRHATIQVRVL